MAKKKESAIFNKAVSALAADDRKLHFKPKLYFKLNDI